MKSILALPLCVVLGGCGSQPTVPTQATRTQPTAQPAAIASPRFDPAKIASMKKSLLAEPAIADVMYQDGSGQVAWTVAVHDDGTSRRGFATYVCLKLAEEQLVRQHTDVRVVDVVKVQSGDFRGASLGHVDCSTGEDLGA